MPSQVRTWPDWPEFTSGGPKYTQDADFLKTKKAVIERYGRDAIRESWLQVCEDLNGVTEEISSKGSSIIPIFDTEKVLAAGGLSDEESDEAKRVGCFVFRATIPSDEANKAYENLKEYLDDNKGLIQGWPAESPSMLILYDSPAQNFLRAHPRQLGVQRILNSLWHDKTGKTSSEPLVYYDGVRDRAPDQPFLGLGPHIDAGSLCRWADDGYLQTYDRIFSGKIREHDCYDLSVRQNANQEMFPGMAHSSVFRAFQGWTALTPTAPREGTIMVYPNVSSVIAYVLLRPFFTAPENPDDIMDATKWTFDGETGWFPGTTKPDSQRLSRSSHPHLRLEGCLVHMPKIQAGDSVWWHSDLCHAVDTEHLGSNNASVAFIAACPTTPSNSAYVKRQLEATLAGSPPPDYCSGKDLDETKLKGYVGLNHLSAEAKTAYGFGLLGDEKK